MISLAGRDILHHWGKFLFTGLGLGLLIGVTLSMAGVYRGMVEDGRALVDGIGADMWVVQQGTLGPLAEPSTLYEDQWRSVRALPGVADAVPAIFLTLQVRGSQGEQRVMLAGIVPGVNPRPGWPRHLVAGRPIRSGHYEAIADEATGFSLGDTLRIRRHDYTVVGLTRRMVSPSGDPMLFIPLHDAQQVQYLKDNDFIRRQRARIRNTEAFSQPGNQALQSAVEALILQPAQVNAILVALEPGAEPASVSAHIRQWLRLTVYDRRAMEDVLVGKLIATAARQIGMFLAILAVVSATIVAFIIHSLTLDKIREIAVLKLIGTRNRTIAAMILQQALALGMIGFLVGRISASLAAPHFPKYVLLTPADSALGFTLVLLICTVASLVAIRMALRVDPAEAIGG